MSAPEPPSPTSFPSGRYRALHLAAFAGLAVAQPLYDLLGRDPTFFVAHSARAVDLVLYALALTVGVPLAMASAERIASRLSTKLGAMVFALELGLLFSLVAAQLLKRVVSSHGWLVVASALLAGALATFAYQRLAALRSVVTVVSPAALLFPLLFLLFSPARAILKPEAGAEVSASRLEHPANVVLVVFDELPVTSLMNREGRVDSERYPAFGALAPRATWFANASAVAQNTHYAVPAILTGRYPDRTRSPLLSDYPENLFTLLAPSHQLRVVEILTMLCPDRLNAAGTVRATLGPRLLSQLVDSVVVYAHLVSPRDLAQHLPPIGATWRDFVHPFGRAVADDPHSRWGDSTWVFERFLATVSRVERPTLFFLHLNLPHLPWKYLPSGKEYGPAGSSVYPHGVYGEVWSRDEWEVTQGWQRHLMQVVLADRLLGRLLDRLEQDELYDDALVIVTADHGVSFRPGQGRRPVTENNGPDVLAVPLFVKLPGQHDATVSERNVETIDILPTIADVLGAELPWRVDGRSVLNTSTPEREQKVIFKNDGNKLADRLVFPPSTAGKEDSLERMAALFGQGQPLDQLYAIGPHRELLGKRIDELLVGVPQELDVVIEQPWELERVRLDSGYLPAHVVGWVRGRQEIREPVQLAVTLNGTVAATTRTYGSPSTAAPFTAMLPERLFREGANAVEVYVIAEEGGVVALAPITSNRPGAYELVVRDDGIATAILAPDGRRYEIVKGAFAGEVARDGLTVSGWAADLAHGRPPEGVAVFLGTRFLFIALPVEDRPEIAARLGQPAMTRCGFRFVIPDVLLDSGEPLRVFAGRDGVASELPAAGPH